MLTLHVLAMFKVFKFGYTQLIALTNHKFDDYYPSLVLHNSLPPKMHQNPTISSDRIGEQQNHHQVVGEIKMYRWFKIYRILSTGYMLYATLRTSISSLSHWYNQVGAHCYLPGVFVMPLYDPLSATSGFIFGGCHLGWRLAQSRPRQRLRVPMVFYMMQPEDAVRRSLKLFGQEHTESRLLELRNRNQLTRLDLFVHNILYYTIRHETRIDYKLRPNRTLESRQQMTATIARGTLVWFLIFLLLFCVIFPLCSIDLLRDVRYVSKYPGCEPELDRLAAENRLGYWSVSLTAHRIYSFCFDFLENFIIWIDSAWALQFCLPIAYQLNCDVLLYWQSMHPKLVRLLDRLLLGRPKVTNRRKYWRGPIFEPSLGRRGQRMVSTTANAEDIRTEILELQAEIGDFFRQIQMNDAFMSEIISGGLIIWLFSWSVLTYTTLIKNQASHAYKPLTVRLYGAPGLLLLGFCFSPLFLLSLYRKTMLSHRYIVSMMALTEEPELKVRFSQILDIYTDRRSTYTVFHEIPLRITTYLTVFAWSISVLFIIENLFQKR